MDDVSWSPRVTTTGWTGTCSEARKNYTHKDLPKADEETYLSKPPVHSTRMSEPINDTKDSK